MRNALAPLLAGRERYIAIARETPGLPWPLVGIIHGMEASYRFNAHLHNGNLRTARRVQHPAGRPLTGQPPFTWKASALADETDFSLPHLLYYFEKFNGFGYRPKGVPSPYPWGRSTLYKNGKFIADHVFIETYVSGQMGTAVLLKELEKQGLFRT
jgi:lysozyme family protein